ncbi:MAG TPA: hypothetical protein VM509_08280, partial [Planctomycetota bacterium]|nr:hypothetical protein [Planctomycetota bacterium]
RLPNGQRLVALDLAVPRDLAPTDDPRVTVVDLEGLRTRADENRAAREQAGAEAELLIEKKLASFTRAALDRRSASAVAELHGESQAIVEREIASLSDARFQPLSAEQRRAIEAWARQAFGRLEHAPIRAIKRWLDEQPGVEERS